MNTKEPLIAYEEETELKSGVKIAVRGEVFEKSLWPVGDPVFTTVRFMDKENNKTWLVFFKEPMTEKELKKTVKKFSKNVDIWVK